MILLLLEREEEGEREKWRGDIDVREKQQLVVSHMCPNQELNSQLGYVP